MDANFSTFLSSFFTFMAAVITFILLRSNWKYDKSDTKETNN